MGRSDEMRKMTALEKELAEKDKLSQLLFKAIAVYQAKETSIVREGLQKIVSNQFYLQFLESHHQAVVPFQPSLNG
jgi:hypothetical protein